MDIVHVNEISSKDDILQPVHSGGHETFIKAKEELQIAVAKVYCPVTIP